MQWQGANQLCGLGRTSAAAEGTLNKNQTTNKIEGGCHEIVMGWGGNVTHGISFRGGDLKIDQIMNTTIK